jgi:hypothetical protein
MKKEEEILAVSRRQMFPEIESKHTIKRCTAKVPRLAKLQNVTSFMMFLNS